MLDTKGVDRKRFIFLVKHERRQNGAHVSFIDYKGTPDWLLARILKWIADRLILYPNHRSIERNFSNAFKNIMKAAYRQQ